MRSVLIIEDDAPLRFAVQSILRAAGYHVITAADGREGIAAFRENQPDAVITDIIMPEQDGIETIMHVRSIAPSCPVVAISGGGRIGNADFLQMAERAGASVVLTKPFENSKLLAAVDEALTLAVKASLQKARS